MSNFKKFFVVLVTVMLLAFICAGFGAAAFAEEPPTPPEQTEDTDKSPPDNIGGEIPAVGIDGIAEQFIAYLKDKYGEDYDFYYNKIIEKWGSMEGYLLAFGDKLPEEYRTGWDKFVGWLREYAPIWAVPLSVIVVIIVVVSGKKAFNSAIERIVNTKIKPVVQELNLQSGATVTIMRAQKALLGNVPKFEENVKELEQAEKELTNG